MLAHLRTQNTSAHTCTCTHMHTGVCVYAQLQRACTHTRLHTHTHTHTYSCTLHIHRYTHTHTYTHTHISVCTCKQKRNTRTHVLTSACAWLLLLICRFVCTPVRTCMHACQRSMVCTRVVEFGVQSKFRVCKLSRILTNPKNAVRYIYIAIKSSSNFKPILRIFRSKIAPKCRKEP
jgi:hypothetical protein